MKKPIIAVLTGAGMSAESGLKTFRDADGLWEGHDVMEVATPQGWKENQELVLKFYNDRRRQLLEVKPNAAHKALVALEAAYEVHIITQNVDDLHERAGSSNVMHLHGELLKVRSTQNEQLVLDWKGDLNTGDTGEDGAQLRPHIVWFGEAVPLLDAAAAIVQKSDYVLIIGTSMQVYPAAGLIEYAEREVPIYFIDPNPTISPSQQLTVFAENASTGVVRVVEKLITDFYPNDTL